MVEGNTGTQVNKYYFAGTHYEVTDGVVTKYYYAGAQRIAMRKDGTLNYLLGDHLGSTSLSTDAAGNVVSELRYKAWGEVRYASGTTPTDYTYTGQYSYASDFGLLFYNARWYDPYLNHFTQPDTIIPDPYNPQAWDRYAYALNNPIRYNDPSGHDVDCGIGDSYCNDARREYYYSWRKYLGGSFKVYLRAKDAYEFYYNHPDVALKDMFENETESVSGWEGVDPYTLGDFYSQYVKHLPFNPVPDDYIVREVDRLNALRDAGEAIDPYYYAALIIGLMITMGPDGGGGGGYGVDENVSKTLRLIDAGGPFPFKQDGQIFRNREGLLPSKPSGYYNEYTVVAPGASNRGPARIVTGQNGEVYFTPDHYQTFVQIR